MEKKEKRKKRHNWKEIKIRVDKVDTHYLNQTNAKCRGEKTKKLQPKIG